MAPLPLLLLLLRFAAGELEPAQLSSFGAICEMSETWTDLTGDPTVYGVRNIKWGKIDADTLAKVDSYLSTIATKKMELEKLQPRIEEALEKEKAPFMDDAGVDDLIGKAVGPFSSLDKARATECGHPRKRDAKGKRDKSVRGAFQKTLDGFPDLVKGAFQEQRLLLDDERFAQRFKELVGSEGYCPQLGQQLRDLAKQAARRPHVTESPKLLNQQQALLKDIQEEEEKLRQCEAARESIFAFKDSLESHVTEVDARNKDVRDAEDLLEDAENDLDALAESLAESEEQLGEAIAKLEADEKAVKEAKTSLEALEEEEKGLKEALNKTTTKMTEVTGKLTATRRADKVIEELRDAVSAVTLKMRLFFEASALKPIENAGLSRSTDLEDYFAPSLTDVPGEGELRQRVGDLTAFCSEEAMPAFKLVKDVDLSPLCATGDEASIMESLHTSMAARIKAVKASLLQVQSWFDPLKGQDTLTDQDVLDRRAAGEPEGLREIVAVYMSSRFYQYLKNWRLRGTFLTLIAQLNTVMGDLSHALAELETEAKELTGKYESTAAARKEAEEKLQKALEAKEVTEEQKATIEATIESLKAEATKMQSQKEDYEERLRLARERLKAAEQQLLEAHKEGTAFPEAVDEGLQEEHNKLEN